MEARRIMCYGVCGSGKTTMARRISERTGLPCHLVDEFTWLPGWKEVSLEEQVMTVSAIVAEDAWVLDTAYGKWIEVPLSRVELIVALDYPRWFSFGRLLRRTLARNIDKKLVCNGNVETWRNTFSRNSILVWHFQSFSRKRARIRRWQASPDGPAVIAFRSSSQAERWLQSLEPNRGVVPID
jgi:adenylate kinase family enzyme